jgi:hypothetical protein
VIKNIGKCMKNDIASRQVNEILPHHFVIKNLGKCMKNDITSRQVNIGANK